MVEYLNLLMTGRPFEKDILCAENDILIANACTVDYDAGVKKKTSQQTERSVKT